MSDQEFIEQELKQEQCLNQSIPTVQATSFFEEFYHLTQLFKPWPNGGE